MADTPVVQPSRVRRFGGGPLRWLFSILLVPAMFLALGAAAQAPADTSVSTWYTTAGNTNWTYPSGSGVNDATTRTVTGVCPANMPASGCLDYNQSFGNTGEADSPAVSLQASSTYKYYLSMQCTSGASVLTLSVSGVVTASGLAVTYNSASGTCTTAQFSAPTTTGNVTLKLIMNGGTPASEPAVQAIQLMSTQATYSGGGATGSLGFPLLDLTAISSNVGLFFSFMSPLLWILLGIGVAGIILARARNFV